MYRIINTQGDELGMVDHVLYIKIPKSGCFAPCKQEEAIGVALNSTPYNLLGHKDIEGADTVIVSQCDGGELMGSLDKVAQDTGAMLADQEYRLTLLELGVSEIDV